jgi:hypothetical protein
MHVKHEQFQSVETINLGFLIWTQQHTVLSNPDERDTCPTYYFLAKKQENNM